MARNESDRGDLWSEAVALTDCVEFVIAGDPTPLLAGYRPNGWCSIYWGQDVMLQFTPESGLRRAYRLGELFRTQGTTLARLVRHRTEQESILLRHDLTPSELAEFRQWVQEKIQSLHTALTSSQTVVSREARTQSDSVLARLEESLAAILASRQFLAPPIAGKK